MDSWTADVYRLDPSLQKDFTMAKLQAEGDQDTDTIGIEANHGNLRKMVFQRVQACKMSILDLDTLWVARQGNNEDVEERGEDALIEEVGGLRRKDRRAKRSKAFIGTEMPIGRTVMYVFTRNCNTPNSGGPPKTASAFHFIL